MGGLKTISILLAIFIYNFKLPTSMKKVWLLIGILLLASCGTPQEAVPGAPFEVETPVKVEEPAETPVETPTSSGEIVMGAIMPLSGDGAAYGEPISRQLLIAVDTLNAEGGINGKNVRIILEDGKCNPKDGATAANKLVNVDEVKVIFGGVCSGETLGAAPIVEEAGVIMISPSATSPDISNAGEYIFRTAPSDAFAGGVAAQAAYDLGFRKAAILSANTDYSQGLHKVFNEVFIDFGGEIVAAESYNTEDTDYKTTLLKLKKKNPDVLYYVPQFPASAVKVITQANQLKFDVAIFTAEVLIGRDIVKEHAVLFEGITGVEAAFDEEGEIAKKVMADYRAKHGEPAFPFYQAAARDALYLVADAMKEHGEDTEKVRDALAATKDWEGAIGKLTMDEFGDPILDFAIQQIQDGKVVKIE